MLMDSIERGFDPCNPEVLDHGRDRDEDHGEDVPGRYNCTMMFTDECSF